jgi:predicted transcriptional regulator
MSEINKLFIKKNSSIKEAMAVIDKGAIRFALVVDDDEKICGVVTDGDIRRGILRGTGINESIMNVVNKNFVYAEIGMKEEEILEILEKNQVGTLPLIDENKKVKDILMLKESELVSYPGIK